jgi:hypothetical protein
LEKAAKGAEFVNLIGLGQLSDRWKVARERNQKAKDERPQKSEQLVLVDKTLPLLIQKNDQIPGSLSDLGIELEQLRKVRVVRRTEVLVDRLRDRGGLGQRAMKAEGAGTRSNSGSDGEQARRRIQSRDIPQGL